MRLLSRDSRIGGTHIDSADRGMDEECERAASDVRYCPFTKTLLKSKKAASIKSVLAR